MEIAKVNIFDEKAMIALGIDLLENSEKYIGATLHLKAISKDLRTQKEFNLDVTGEIVSIDEEDIRAARFQKPVYEMTYVILKNVVIKRWGSFIDTRKYTYFINSFESLFFIKAMCLRSLSI